MKYKSKYTAKKPFLITYIVLCCVCLGLVVGRWYSVIDADYVFINAEIHSHLSNFVLSMVFYLAAGYAWLLVGVKFRYIAVLGIVLIVGNFICETVMGYMNTVDVMDAVYGTAGTVIIFAFLLITNNYGLVLTNSEES